ncbi:hypothetical protein DWF00_05875 [Bosea caraganae]|uniref:YgjV family protein n=1 Tax=Bosea caraganae TaxID=2763117 RepID=A0A370L3B3_9HYPH|nr:hypothetical protein [Bosea caraganae]RDJ22891.1 hypothetical protein DWE98_17120 [Bosea caraganae]RDJ28671.1 hypothetical protein DWF00_05875 [Bosea caraganae]
MMPVAALTDLIGFLAAGMTLTAFCCTQMISLRAAAILANLLFIAYGALLNLTPVLGLHCILLPLNLLRFAGCMRERQVDLPGRATGPCPLRRAPPLHH